MLEVKIRNTAVFILVVVAMSFAIIPKVEAGVSPNWNPEADLDGDGDVDTADQVILHRALGSQADP